MSLGLTSEACQNEYKQMWKGVKIRISPEYAFSQNTYSWGFVPNGRTRLGRRHWFPLRKYGAIALCYSHFTKLKQAAIVQGHFYAIVLAAADGI